jgi:hypothetical protein
MATEVTLEQARTVSGKDSVATIVKYMVTFPTDVQVHKLAGRALLKHDGLAKVDSLEKLAEWQNQAAADGAVEAVITGMTLVPTDEDLARNADEAGIHIRILIRDACVCTHSTY